MNFFSAIRKRKRELIASKVEHSKLIRRYFFLIVGVLIYAISYNLFFIKNNLVFGGVGGISIITQNYIDPTLMILILSIFLLIISYFTLGKKATLNSVVGSLLFPLFVQLTKNIGNYITISNDDLLLIALVGGVSIGIGSGIVFKTGFTTGGTDIINQIVSKYFKMSIGSAMIMTDGLIVIVGGFFFGWTRVLYAIIVLYIISIMVDKVVLGISSTKALYITTTKEADVGDYLMNELNQGITIIETTGGYSNRKKNMIMSVIPTSEYFRTKEGIRQIDPTAIIIATDAYQSVGTYGSKRGGH